MRKPEKSQSDCRDMFIKELEELSGSLEDIDNQTPWSEREPSWWLDMNNLQRDIRTMIQKHKHVE